MKNSDHISVLLEEVLEGLDLKPNHVVVDATISGGGHSERIVELLNNQGILMGIDMDSHALDFARERLAQATSKVILKQGNFRHLDTYLLQEGITQVDRFLFDLGISSRQLDYGKRGFAFRFDEPLLMTFNDSPGEGDLTAKEIVTTWDEENIADIIFGYGDERYARRIAKAIVESRKESPIETTGDLVSIIEGSVPAAYKRGRIHPATKTFQALRITVNDEMQSTKEALEKALAVLAPEGRIAVISFHSTEDRIVKHAFKDWKEKGEGIILTKKPITATDAELEENKRSRSAKLRIFQKN